MPRPALHYRQRNPMTQEEVDRSLLRATEFLNRNRVMVYTSWRCKLCGSHGQVHHLASLNAYGITELVRMEHWKNLRHCAWDDEEILIKRVR